MGSWAGLLNRGDINGSTLSCHVPRADLLLKSWLTTLCQYFIANRHFGGRQLRKTFFWPPFLALDPERIGDTLISSGERTDLGDDVLMYKTNCNAMHDNVEHFLTKHVDK